MMLGSTPRGGMAFCQLSLESSSPFFSLLLVRLRLACQAGDDALQGTLLARLVA